MSIDIGTWLRICITCGKPHECRPVVECDGPPDHWVSKSPRVTWGDPVDGHPYCSRLTNPSADQLQADYEREQNR